MSRIHQISSEILTIERLQEIISGNYRLQLSEESEKLIDDCANYLRIKINSSDDLLYGINTGFGSLCNIRISNEEISELQHNLIRSHAAGIGDEVPRSIVKLMILLKIQSLSYGKSGIRLKVVNRLIDFYNKDVIPVVYQLGSLGASGDLAPLAHLSLPLLGEGMVYLKDQKMPTAEAFRHLNLEPIELHPKEGLALLNGTQFSTAYASWCLIETTRTLRLANLCAAISIDAFQCRLSPFDDRLHQIRPHEGQIDTAAFIRNILKGSEIAEKTKNSVQDPYAFRCVPQVHGASMGAVNHIQSVILTEINAVTDNPNIFPEDDIILSGGNFHAQPIALALDYLAIAIAEIGSISERRLYQLISGQRGLPAFLTPEPGLNSGLMIAQYTAASIVSQNKQYCTPASVDSIVSCNGQEDHVSMAANAATKAYKVVQNVERLIAIEFMAAAQAMEFRRPAESSSMIEYILTQYRNVVPVLKNDRILSDDMFKTIDFLKTITF